MAYVVIVIHIRGTRDKAGPYLLSVNLTIEIWSLIAKKRKKTSSRCHIVVVTSRTSERDRT